MVLFPALLFMNCISEYLLTKMMVAMDVLEKKYTLYHTLCALLRIIWIFFGAWFGLPLPFLLMGLFILLFLNVLPYPGRRLLMNNFIMIIYLIYTSLLMTVIGSAGLLGLGAGSMTGSVILRAIVMNATFFIFNVICVLLLHFHPEFLWRENYDRYKVAIYTRFLTVCAVYHILDAAILSLYPINRSSYLLLVSGDVLILVLMFNFFNYNYVFEKSEDMRRRYEESEVLMAQRYFEKESLKKLSGLDSLTHAYNRREICSLMAESIKRERRLICVFMDLDGLKRINDKYGHTFGDLMLKRFAGTCEQVMEGKGRLARIGGDEFLLVFEDGDMGEIEAHVRRLQLKLLEPAESKDKISFSYGISWGEESVESYIHLADQRMYLDKNRKQCDDICMEKL